MINYKEFYEMKAFEGIRNELGESNHPLTLSEYYNIEKFASEKQRWEEIRRNYKLKKLVERRKRYSCC